MPCKNVYRTTRWKQPDTMNGQNMRRYMPLVPALCTFGPMEMVLGYDTPYHLLAIISSLISAVGILIIFANVMELIRKSEPRLGENAETPSVGKKSAAVVVVLAALIVGAAAIVLVTRTYH